MTRAPACIGCAGWRLPADTQAEFGEGTSHLHRYATRLNACEINSSFHRPHNESVYRRWADSVPADFRFSVKVPKIITHEHKLRDAEGWLDEFLVQARGLGTRLGCLLVQLPPSLAFDRRVAQDFFTALRKRWDGVIATEPRHASWFDAPAERVLSTHQVTRVLADPVRHPAGALPGGWPDVVYLRLHGSPRVYYSAYEPPLLSELARRIGQAVREGRTVWCIFDNTAAGAAANNALGLRQAMDKEIA